MCAEFEYEPHGIFGTGHSQALGPAAKARRPKPIGFLAAHKRAAKAPQQKPPTRRR